MPNPADYFAPAVLGKQLEERLSSPQGRRKPKGDPLEMMRTYKSPVEGMPDIAGWEPSLGANDPAPDSGSFDFEDQRLFQKDGPIAPAPEGTYSPKGTYYRDMPIFRGAGLRSQVARQGRK